MILEQLRFSLFSVLYKYDFSVSCHTCGELSFHVLLPLQRKRDCETRITHSACQLINEGNKQNLNSECLISVIWCILCICCIL